MDYTHDPEARSDSTETIDVIEYNRMPPDMWQEIQEVEIVGSYGSKIESLAKHLIWLQERDTGSKSIVFSAWADVSTVLMVLIF